jgi:ParB family chromosome partitioning protein
MTTIIDDRLAGEPGDAGTEDAAVPEEKEQAITNAGGRPVVAVALLAAHPGNVRRDLALDEELLASVRELGILTPLRVTPEGDGYRVIEGHRRLAAAITAGLTEVPCDVASDRAGDEAGQYLDMYAANHHRRDLTTLEEADALFAASVAGASRTRIRKATGLGKEDVTAALAAGKLTGAGRDAAAGLGYEASLDQLALLEEFNSDGHAIDRLMGEFTPGRQRPAHRRGHPPPACRGHRPR